MRVSKRLARFVVTASLPALAWGLAPSTAHAQDADIAQARQLGQQAQTAYDAGNYAESEKLWAAAAKLYAAAPTLTLGLARTQAKLGRYVAASESYNRIIREWSSVASPAPAFKDALEAARTEVVPVQAKVASVILTVEGPASPTVTIDGQSVPAAGLGLKRPIDPGAHVVKATGDGFKPGEQKFQVGEAGSVDVRLKLERAAEVATVPPPAGGQPVTEPPPEGSKKGGSKTLAFAAFGVGGAGLVVGSITGLVAIGKHGDLKDKCPDAKCPASAQSDVDSYKTMGTLSTVGFIVAGAGAVAGTVLLFTGSKEAAAKADVARYATVQTKGVTLTPYFGGSAAGVTGQF